MNRLYDDHQTNDTSTQTGQVTTMTAGESQGQGQGQMQATGTGQQSAQPGGLDADSSVSGENPVAAAVEASNWTHDDLAVVLSALSLIAWVATTIYVQRNT